MSANAALLSFAMLASLGATLSQEGLYFGLGTVGGRRCVGYVDFTGNSSDTETITLTDDEDKTDVYEMDTNSSVTAGNVAVDVSGGVTASESATALAAAINGNSNSNLNFAYEASVLSGGETVAIYQTGEDSVERRIAGFTLAETLANGTAASGVNGAEATQKHLALISHTVLAGEVTQAEIAIANDFDVEGCVLLVRTSSTNAIKLVDGDVHLDGELINLNLDGSTDLAAGDVIMGIAWGSVKGL